MKNFIISLISSVVLVSANQVIFRQSNPQYYTDYGIDNHNPTNEVLFMALNLNNIDVTNMTSKNGFSGLYMGIGFGNT